MIVGVCSCGIMAMGTKPISIWLLMSFCGRDSNFKHGLDFEFI